MTYRPKKVGARIRELRDVEGENVRIEYRLAEERDERLGLSGPSCCLKIEDVARRLACRVLGHFEGCWR